MLCCAATPTLCPSAAPTPWHARNLEEWGSLVRPCVFRTVTGTHRAVLSRRLNPPRAVHYDRGAEGSGGLPFCTYWCQGHRGYGAGVGTLRQNPRSCLEGKGLSPVMPAWNPTQTLAPHWARQGHYITPLLSLSLSPAGPLKSHSQNPPADDSGPIQGLEQERPSLTKKKKLSVCLSLVLFVSLLFNSWMYVVKNQGERDIQKMGLLWFPAGTTLSFPWYSFFFFGLEGYLYFIYFFNIFIGV